MRLRTTFSTVPANRESTDQYITDSKNPRCARFFVSLHFNIPGSVYSEYTCNRHPPQDCIERRYRSISQGFRRVSSQLRLEISRNFTPRESFDSRSVFFFEQ